MYRRTATDRKLEAARHRQMTEEMAGAIRTNIPGIVREQARQERKIPTVSLEVCDYDKDRKVLKMASEYIGMPETFFVKSHHTGKEVRFVVVGPEDKLFDGDGWDGEMQVYRPLGNVPGVDHMVIYHAA